MFLQYAVWYYGWFCVIYLFLLTPLCYFILGRPFDRKFEMKTYFFEKGFPGSFMIRLHNYTQGIAFHSYRDGSKTKSLLAKYVNKHFTYQSRLYGRVIDFHKHATKLQLFIGYLYFYSTIIFMVGLLSFLAHDFILFPNERLGSQ